MTHRSVRLILSFLVLIAVSAFAADARAVVIDFEGLAPGTIVTDDALPDGFTIDVDNAHSQHPDAALIYDTACASGVCSGGDDDLRTPGVGLGNDSAQGNMLIIATDVVDEDPVDGLVDDPDDEQSGGTIVFSLPEPATLRSMRIVDVDINEPDGFLELFLAASGTSVIPIPPLGNNSAQTIEIVDAPLVDGFAVYLFSSGAIDDIAIDEDLPRDDDTGDECPVPNSEICNNGIDDDGDGRIDCADPDCPLGIATCGEDGEEVPPCERIRRDPAKIRFDTHATGADSIKVHGRFFLHSDVELGVEGFSLLLTNVRGVVFHGTLAEGELHRKRGGKGRYVFVDRQARNGGPGDADNLFRVSVRVRNVDGLPAAVFRVRAYGDLSLATERLMTLQVTIGDDVAVLEAPWRERSRGWVLRLRDFR